MNDHRRMNDRCAHKVQRPLRAVVSLLVLLSAGGLAEALEVSVPRINGDVARTLFGDGTGVVVGIIDSGVDDLHPALSGLDSLGMPRLVAEANFVTTELGNTGDDVFGHGTAVAAVALGNDSIDTGLATDARYVNARVLNTTNSFSTDSWVVNGAGFAIENGADVLNLSLNLNAIGSDASSKLSLMADHISYALDIPVVISVGNNGSSSSPGHNPRGPADAFNVFSVAATEAPGYDQIASFSSFGPTEDGRSKPDISAPGESITTANDDWEGAAPDYENWSGTSFAAPHVTGMLALQIDYARANGLSTDPLALKATLLNSAEKIADRNGNPWEPEAFTQTSVLEVTQPLDNQSGTGQIDGEKLFEQFSAGEQGPGLVGPVGWDLDLVGDQQSAEYIIENELAIGSTLTTTLTWERQVGRTDNGNDVFDSADSFFLSQPLDNLDLEILRDGNVIATSISTVDNLEHLTIPITDAGEYSFRVFGLDLSAGPVPFGIAWFGTAVSEAGSGSVPEPNSSSAGFVLLAGVVLRRRRTARGRK